MRKVTAETKNKKAMQDFLGAYSISPDMLYLKSQKDDTEAHIYQRDYVNHKLSNNEFIVETKRETYSFPI